MSISTKGANKTQNQTTDNVKKTQLWMGMDVCECVYLNLYLYLCVYICLTVCQMKCFIAMKMGKLLPVSDVATVFFNKSQVASRKLKTLLI